MQSVAKELSPVVRKTVWSKPKFPIYSNVTGKAITDGASLQELAQKHTTSSVLWIDAITGQYESGARAWVEVGPKGILSRMVKPILEEIPGVDEVSILTAGSLKDAAAL
jgi:[acyl-carrier-protein] S-malonyltransferase